MAGIFETFAYYFLLEVFEIGYRVVVTWGHYELEVHAYFLTTVGHLRMQENH